MKYYEGKIDKVTFIAGHGMILSHCPEKLTLAQVAEKISTNPSQEIEKFGLFDSSTPNYATYYPDVTTEDLQPKDSDFIEPVFRMLSNTVVQHKYNPIEFPSDVLKASMNKLVGQTINVDHETALGNGIGAVKAVSWQEAYTIGGFNIPAGINAVLKIDGKSNPRIARGIMMEPPSIHSNSVTVAFAWKPSHDNLTESDFYNKLGTFDEKGKLIRKVATDIKFYAETSLVGMGADPFAQRIKDGRIVNPGMAKSREPIQQKQLSAEEIEFGIIATLDWKNTTEVVYNSLPEVEDENNNQNTNEMNELLRFLETLFGFNAESLTEENYQEQLNTIGVKLSDLTTEITTLKEAEVTVEGIVGTENIANALKELVTLKASIPEGQEIAGLAAMAIVGNNALSALKADTLRLYKLSLKGKAEDTNIISLINTSDFTTVKALNTQYDNLTEDDCGFVCTDCNSTNVTRAKAEVSEEGKDFTSKTSQEVINKFTTGQKAKFTMYSK